MGESRARRADQAVRRGVLGHAAAIGRGRGVHHRHPVEMLLPGAARIRRWYKEKTEVSTSAIGIACGTALFMAAKRHNLVSGSGKP